MKEGNIEYARLLLNQGRLAEAEKQLKDALSEEPENLDGLYLYGHTLIQESKFKEAEEVLNKALTYHPNNAILFYTLATLELHRGNYKKTLEHVNFAIAMEPFHAEFFSVKSQGYFFLNKFQEALDAAEEGLEIDPENTICLNMRSNALHRLGRKEEAYDGLEMALEKEPENVYTFANMGWKALEDKQTARALEYFKEALRLDPTYEYAIEGMKQALKARYLVYRWFLDFSFWINKNGKQASLGFTIAFNVLYRIVKSFSFGLGLLLLGLFLSMWIITPVADALLLLHPLGKYAVTKREKLSSALVMFCLLACGAGLLAYFIGHIENGLGISYIMFFLAIPAGNVFKEAKLKWAPTTLALLSVVAAALSVGAMVAGADVYNLFTFAVVILVSIFTWVV